MFEKKKESAFISSIEIVSFFLPELIFSSTSKSSLAISASQLTFTIKILLALPVHYNEAFKLGVK
jgi:hypothetical protein